jgi:hypothetical protein
MRKKLLDWLSVGLFAASFVFGYVFLFDGTRVAEGINGEVQCIWQYYVGAHKIYYDCYTNKDYTCPTTGSDCGWEWVLDGYQCCCPGECA